MNNDFYRKPRTERVGFSTRDKVDSVRFEIDSVTGRIVTQTPAINGYFEVAYTRAKGEKILSRIPIPPTDLDFYPDKAIEKNFDVLFGVDTNTREISGRKISVTGVSELHTVFFASSSAEVERGWQIDTPICFAFTRPRDQPERAGWGLASDFIHTSPKYARYPRVGLVVDSYLSEIQEFNARRRPFVATSYLPERVTLIYVSFDGGGEYFMNQLIRQADRVSRFCLQKIDAGEISLSQNGIPGAFESLLRIINGKDATPIRPQ